MLVTLGPEELARLPADSLSDELERGRVVRFSRCPIALPADDDLRFLRDDLGALLAKKNVSWYPEADRLTGVKGQPEAAERARRILREHSARVNAFLRQTMPSFTRGLVQGTSSFRPLQEKGRDLSAHASNERLHVDAGAYGATHGARILRFFVNVNPAEERVWASKGAFHEVYARHAAEAGLAGVRVEDGALDRVRSGAVRGLTALLPMARVLDGSPYDRAMRKFHNWMKDTPSFQAPDSSLQTFSFAPFEAWMVLTDGVTHACLSGQHALVDTFLVPLESCRLRELTPYEILRAGRVPA